MGPEMQAKCGERILKRNRVVVGMPRIIFQELCAFVAAFRHGPEFDDGIEPEAERDDAQHRRFLARLRFIYAEALQYHTGPLKSL